jgi:hypothetical protein
MAAAASMAFNQKEVKTPFGVKFSCIVRKGAQPSAVCYPDHLVWQG